MVTHSGDFDGTFVYTYDAWKIAQVNDGSGNMVQQFIAPWTRRVPLRGTAARRRRAKRAAKSQGQAARREPALGAWVSPVRRALAGDSAGLVHAKWDDSERAGFEPAIPGLPSMTV